MTATQSTALLQAERVVDVDVHLSIPEETLAEYADEPHSSYLRAPSVQLKNPEWDPNMGERIPHRDLTTPEQVVEDVCGELHVDLPIVNVFRNLSRLSNPDRAVALQRACNDLLFDRFLDDHEFIGLGTVQTQTPDQAAEEIDRLGGEDDVVGVFLPTTGPLPPLGDPTYDSIYAALADNDLTPVFHGATNSGFDIGFPTYNRAFNQFVEAHVNAHLWSQTMTLTSLLVHGVPEKFPDLDFVMLEAGIGWVPYMMFRLNKEIAMRSREAPLLEQAPEAYIRESFYFASQPLGEPNDPADMGALLDIVGVDSLLFASDYPHWDFDHPSELDGHLRRQFSERERGKVLHGNAIEAFDIDVGW